MSGIIRLRQLLSERGSAKELSKATGISQGNISDWLNGRSKPSSDKLILIADYFDCSVDYLLGRTRIKEVNLSNNKIIYLPIMSQKASAGLGYSVNDLSDSEITTRCFDREYVPSNATHGIIIYGHSMEDKFFNKQIVFICQGLECAAYEYGIFVSDKSNGTSEAYCKQKRIAEDGTYYLHSINPEYPDIHIGDNNILNIRCVGKILE